MTFSIYVNVKLSFKGDIRPLKGWHPVFKLLHRIIAEVTMLHIQESFTKGFVHALGPQVGDPTEHLDNSSVSGQKPQQVSLKLHTHRRHALPLSFVLYLFP